MPEKYYVRGDSKSSFESMTKEEILAAITQAVEGGTIGDIDSGFVTKIKEIHNGNNLRFWVGTSAEYNALAETDNNVLYIITDDTSAADINSRFTEHDAQLETQAAAIAENAGAIYQLQHGGAVIARTAWIFGEIAAGDKEEMSYTLTAEEVAAADGNPTVLVSPILIGNDTYNPDLKYYGYFKASGNAGRFYFGVYNGGSTAVTPPDAAVVVI